LPSERAARIALRSQQIIAHESGVADAADPLGGSWLVESLTEEIHDCAADYIERIDGMGGAVEVIESGWMKNEIEEAAYRINTGVESGERVVVGVNKFVQPIEEPMELHELDLELQAGQIGRLEALRDEREGAAVETALKELEEAARGDGNLLYPMREALAAYATLGEVSEVLRRVFGEYEPAGF
jgi:methylmalonyl-CoA mutase N-terminal domain/subunit